MTGRMRPEPNLVVAGMSLADVKATMSYARVLLETLSAAPRGLLVDTRIAGLTIGAGHRIVAPDGTLRDIPSDEQSRRTLKREVSSVETLMAELASGRSRHWRCDLAEGDIVSCACAAAQDEDILLLCQRPMLGFHGDVLLIGATGSHSATVMATVRALADASAALVSEVRNDEKAAEVLERVDRSRVAAIVVDLTVGPFTSEDDLRHLFSAARCPVVVIGATRIKRPSAQTDAPRV